MATTAKRILVLGMALGVAISLGLASVYAEDAHHDHAATQAATAPFAGDAYLLSTDPVTGGPLGDKPVIYQHEGRELRFTDQKSLETFKADPTKYLPKVDQQLIQQQLPLYPLDTCVVSGDKLGGDMGKPVDIIYKNRLVRFCCADCPKDFNKNPAKFLKMIDDAAQKKSAASKPGASDGPTKSPASTMPAGHQH